MLLLACFIFIFFAILLKLYFQFARHRLQITYDVIQSPSISKVTTLVHLSDFHFIPTKENLALSDAVDALSNMEADYIFLTGDFINHAVGPINELCTKFLSRISAKQGVYACLGNHDYYGGNPNAITTQLEKIGITVLRNRLILVDNIQIVGLEDFWSPGWKTRKRALDQIESNPYTIMLSHNPDTFQEFSSYNIDLQLSGHTHGGQICLPRCLPGCSKGVPVLYILRLIFDYFPILLRIPLFSKYVNHHKYMWVVRNWEYAEGRHEKNGTILRTSRGIGSHLNMRLFCAPEMIVTTLIPNERKNS